MMELWWELPWICGLLSVIQQHSLLFRERGRSHRLVFSSGFQSFHYKGFLPPRLGLFLGFNFLVLNFVNGSPSSWYLSLHVHYCYVEKLLVLCVDFVFYFAEGICQVSEFFKYKMMLFANRNKLVLPSHLWLFLFLFFIPLELRLWALCWMTAERMDIPFSFQILEKLFSTSPH